MNGPALAATALACAVLAAPGPPLRRLPRQPPRRRLPATALAATAAAALIVATAALMTPAVALSAALLAVAVAVRVRAGRRRRAAERQTAALGGALEAMVSELRIGAHPVRALTVAAAEAPDVLARVAARASLGGDVPTALTDAAQRSGGPARWRRLAAVWRLADQRGLAVADLMHAAHTDIVERQRHRDAVAAQLAGARATTAILAALPALGIVLGAALGARPLDFLTGPGGWCLLLGVGFLSAGLLWAGRLTDRVLEVS